MVKATRYFAPTRSATSAAALAMTPERVCGSQSMGLSSAARLLSEENAWRSVAAMMRAIVSTVWIG